MTDGFDYSQPHIILNGVPVAMTDDEITAFEAEQTARTAQVEIIEITAAAKAALDATDTVFIRCGKAGVAWPSAWQDYVVALRAIVASPAGVTELPTAPAYPAGT